MHGDGRKATEAPRVRILNGEDLKNLLENREKNDSHFLFKKELEKFPIGEEVNEHELEEGLIGGKVNRWSRLKNFGRRIILSIKTMRRVLASKETLHKYGYVTIGKIKMVYCITEEMVTDLLAKIVSGAQDNRLAVRFYNLYPSAWKYVIRPN